MECNKRGAEWLGLRARPKKFSSRIGHGCHATTMTVLRNYLDAGEYCILSEKPEEVYPLPGAGPGTQRL